MSLLTDLTDATRPKTCPLCAYIHALPDGATRSALAKASAGTIGIQRLSKIMQKNQTGIGRRTIERHRSEGHQP